jgi:hypothetical protein
VGYVDSTFNAAMLAQYQRTGAGAFFTDIAAYGAIHAQAAAELNIAFQPGFRTYQRINTVLRFATISGEHGYPFRPDWVGKPALKKLNPAN